MGGTDFYFSCFTIDEAVQSFTKFQDKRLISHLRHFSLPCATLHSEHRAKTELYSITESHGIPSYVRSLNVSLISSAITPLHFHTTSFDFTMQVYV